MKRKILLLDDLAKKVLELKKDGKVVIQSHGVFDLIHPGILQHLGSAKKQGDVLVVTVVKDKNVRKGPGRPIFTEALRAMNVAALEPVDYVALADDDVPFECVKRIQPDIFAKGPQQHERDQKIHEKIFKEGKELYFGNSRIYETDGFAFSSSQIINNFLDIILILFFNTSFARIHSPVLGNHGSIYICLPYILPLHDHNPQNYGRMCSR